MKWYIAGAIWYTALPYDILAMQAWYNIRSFICRRHISSTEGGYHIEDISPVPRETDIIENTLIVSQWGCFHGGECEIRTLEPFYRLHDFQSCALDQLGDFSIGYFVFALSLECLYILSQVFQNVNTFFEKSLKNFKNF